MTVLDFEEAAARRTGGALDAVGAQLCVLASRIAAATGEFLALLARFDAEQGWAGAGVRSCAHWLSWRCGMDRRTAREHVRTARALQHLPRTAAELAAGRLSYSKVRALARVATVDTEDDLVGIALTAPAAQVERLVRGLRQVADTEQEQAQTDTERAAKAAHRRRMQYRWDDETGELVVWGRFDAADGAVLLAGLTRAEQLRTQTGGGSAEPPPNPDPSGPPPSDPGPALVAMAQLARDAVDAPAHSAAAEVLVHHDAAGGAHLDRGPALDADTSEELMCDARLREVATTAEGCVLHYGRSRRTPSTAQLRALHLRDGGCRAPGCGRTRFLHAHHVLAWSRGGRTDLDNLILLCGGCHRALHLHEYRITADGAQHFSFHRDDEAWDPAPPTQASAADLHAATAHVTGPAVTADWGGDPLDLEYAVSVLVQHWNHQPPAA